MINFIMVIIHILAFLFFLPALLVTIPLHILIVKSGLK
ncbi:Uncharacterised protein [Aliarcobacter butzleri]|nr:Uncharacterised protein [Aliarcobacter butzleri]